MQFQAFLSNRFTVLEEDFRLDQIKFMFDFYSSNLPDSPLEKKKSEPRIFVLFSVNYIQGVPQISSVLNILRVFE